MAPVIGYSRKVASGYSVPAAAFFARITDPGSTRKNLYAALIDGLVADGIWAKLDALWILAADIAGNAVVNLKSSSYTLTNHSATFTTDRGYAGDGSTAYLDTGLNSATATFFTQNSAHMSLWDRTTGATDSTIQMGSSATTPSTHIFAHLGGSLYGRINDASGAGALSNANSDGHFIVNRSSSSATQAYRNGSSLGSNVQTSQSPSGTFFLLGCSNSGSLSTPTSDQLAAASVGGSLDATNAANFYSRLQTYMTAVGA